ncbi:MAG: PilZ domain-containing protein [Nitrospinae bacterium]|nr:PilZ domain-containing protein [Nitrospinota bacterium]
MLGLGKEATIEFARKSGQVMVRGWKTGEQGYLLAEKPRGPLPPLTPGQGAVIRMEKKGVVYGMAVTYKEFLRKTELCLFTFQDDVIARSLRDEDRFQCLLPATIRRADNQASALGSGMIVDLSKGGIRVVTRAPMHAEPGDMLSVSFYPGGIGFMDRQKMRLMRVSGFGSRFEYAAQFADMDKEHAKLLDAYFAFCKTWTV